MGLQRGISSGQYSQIHVARRSWKTVFLIAVFAFVISASSTLPYSDSLSAYGRFAMMGLLAIFLMSTPDGKTATGTALTRFSGLGLFTCFLFVSTLSVLWTEAFSATATRVTAFAVLLFFCWSIHRQRWSVDTRLIEQDLRGVSLFALTSLGGMYLLVAIPNSPLADFGSFQGLLENPNTVGVLAAVSIPPTIGLLVLGKCSKFATVAAIAVASLALIASGSRGGIIATSTGVLLVGYSHVLTRPATRRVKDERDESSKKSISQHSFIFVGTWAFLVAVVAASLLVIGHNPLDSERIWEVAVESGSGRIQAWKAALDLPRSDYLGWGFGATSTVFAPASAGLLEYRGSYVGSSIIQVWLELGPIGLALLALLVLQGVWRASTTLVGRMVVLPMLGAAITVSLVESGLTSPGSILGFSFWLSLTAAHSCGLSLRP